MTDEFGGRDHDFYAHPRLKRVIQVDIPEAGGWIIGFRDLYGTVTYQFIPNMHLWTQAIGDTIAATLGNRQPIALGLDFAHASNVPQPIPGHPGG